jgi:hypothetical protein
MNNPKKNSLKNSLYVVLLLLVTSGNLSAQEETKVNSKLHFGYGLFISYNLYSWYERPATIDCTHSSSGQVFNILPGLGFNFWFGDIDHWIVSLEGAVEYTPFAIDLDKYKGLGALSIPVMAKVQFPIAKQKSLWLMLHAGTGAQFLKTEIFDRPTNLPNNTNPFFVSIVGEVGIHISAVGLKRQHIREIELFVRMGATPFGTMTFNSGLRLTFWNKII